jgi:hypothetical protein
MADDKRDGTTPPGRGEQNHDVMREAARRPISGPGASDFIAAGGGLDLPGTSGASGKGMGNMREDSPLTDPSRLTPGPGPDHEPIPGERDPENITGSQTGTIGGGGVGAHNPSPNRAIGMDDETVHDREIEGGGAESERGKKKK